MNALKCDRCKRYEDIDENRVIIFTLYKLDTKDNLVKHVDLCRSCEAELGKWFEEK